MAPIDNFSGYAEQYARYRPSYPDAFFARVAALAPGRQRVWDCGTGNGQAACLLAAYFEQVEATDISANQLAQAAQRPNINYSVQPAEHTGFPDNYFDLIVVAQAIHWFDLEAFYREALRTARPGALLCILGYHLVSVNPVVDAVILRLYRDITGPYWDTQRKYIDERYQTIPLPFPEVPFPQLEHSYQWEVEQLLQYLGTWSGVKKYMAQTGIDPVGLVENELRRAWGAQPDQKVFFPLIGRLAQLP